LKNLRSLTALETLWRSRLYQDASILARTIFEAHVQCIYLAEDPEERATRFYEYEIALRHAFFQHLLTVSPNKKQWKTDFAELDTDLKQLSKPYDLRQGWYGKSLRKLVRELESRGHKGLSNDYEFLFTITSGFVHSNPSSRQEYLQMTAAGFAPRFRASCPAYMRPFPLLAAGWSVGLGFFVAHDNYKRTKAFGIARAANEIRLYCSTVKGFFERD
jgi:hypothetical protein